MYETKNKQESETYVFLAFLIAFIQITQFHDMYFNKSPTHTCIYASVKTNKLPRAGYKM